MSEAMDTSQFQPTSDNGSRGRANFPVRRPRGNRGRGSHRGKPNDRTTNWRITQNDKVVAQMDAERNARFASYGLGSSKPFPAPQSQPPPTTRPFSSVEFTSVQFLGMAVTPYAQPVPISTQALGFMVNQYYIKLQEQLGEDKVTERCSVHQFYRHSLAQLSFHLYRIRMDQVPRYSFASPYPDPPVIPSALLESFKTLELNVGFITSYIQRIGSVVAHDVPNVPMLMMDASPLYINIFNLRMILDEIGNHEDRFAEFIDKNSIPGLAVANNRITNANAIMPRAYGPAMMYRDASAVRALMNYTTSKMRDVDVYTGRLGQIGEGSPAMLLRSTSTVPEAHVPVTTTGELLPLAGTVDSFWSDHKLTDENNRLGVIGLYVREDTSLAYVPSGNLWLNSATRTYQISADYEAYLNRLIG